MTKTKPVLKSLILSASLQTWIIALDMFYELICFASWKYSAMECMKVDLPQWFVSMTFVVAMADSHGLWA